MMEQSLLILTGVGIFIIIIILISCYVRRRDRVVYLCKEVIESGDECYRCTECSKSQKAILCSACFEASIHTSHNYEIIKVGRGGAVRCHCGLRESWVSTIGTDRMCTDHRNNLKAKIESSCKFVEIKGMRVPVSPDGIPMVNLAKPVDDNGSQTEEKKTDIRTGGMATLKFLQPNIPKIAGDRYRPGAWIPYNDDYSPGGPRHTQTKQFRFIITKNDIEIVDEKRPSYSDYSSGTSSR